MTHSLLSIPDLIRLTIRDPREAARRIIGLGLPTGAMWEALVLVVVLSVIAAQGSSLLSGRLTGDAVIMLPGFFFNPFTLGVFQGVLMAMMVFAVHGVGRIFGGRGAFPDAIALVVWLQFLMVCLQVIQGISLLVVPVLSGMLGLIGVVAFFYLLTQFISVLHGFSRPGMVFAGILASMMVIVFALSILLGLLGVSYVEIPDV